MAKFPNLRRTLARWLDPDVNKWVESFLSTLGGGYTAYDQNGISYVDNGFKANAAVFAVIRQRYEKVRSIPYSIRKINDKKSHRQLSGLIKSTNFAFDPSQHYKYKTLMDKAYRPDNMDMPLKRPNPLQTWGAFWSTYEMFMCLDGNAYFYILKGLNKPNQIYILPSHLMVIIVKDENELSASLKTDSPISGYMLQEGHKYITFEADEIIHVKLPNPDFGQDGSHLYGQSPLKAGLRNIQSFNEAVENNNRMMRNSGAYGLIHGKGHRSLTKGQADQIKEKLESMDVDESRLGQIAGVSAEVGFTRVGLTPNEMKVFDFLNFDEKQIANILGWDARLLNQDSGATFDNLKIAEKRVVSQTTKPSLDMLCEAFNSEVLPRFGSEYAGTELFFDFSELPEMQVNIKELVEWLGMALDRGVITRNEFRVAIGYDPSSEKYMDDYTISQFLEPLKEAIEAPATLDANNFPPEPNPLPE